MPRSTPYRARLLWTAFAVISAAVIAWMISRAGEPPTAPAAAPAPSPITKTVAQQLKKPGASLSSPKAAAKKVAVSAPKVNKPPKAKYKPREVVVLFKADATKAARKALRAQVGAVKHESLGGDAERLTLAKGVSTKDAAAKLAQSDAVAGAERNAVVRAAVAPNDTLYSQQWALNSPFKTDIEAESGWTSTDNWQTPVTVAVIDDGVDFSHPDLANQAYINNGEYGSGKQSNGVDDDGNGYVDDWRGWDVFDNDNNVGYTAQYIDGHGTHVAGIIAAQRNNGIGIAGVSSQARIMAVKILDDYGFGDVATIYKGIKYAIDNGAKVVNGSIGFTGSSNLLDQLVGSAHNVAFVFAAGNSGVSLDSTTVYPCEIPSNNVTCVGSTDESGARSDFSNYSATEVDIAAPGGDILSTVPTAANASGYARYSGTSMASPAVAGVAAVMRSKFPELNAYEVRTRLRNGSLPLFSAGTTASGRLSLYSGVSGSGPYVPTTTGSASVASGRVTYTAPAGTANRVIVAGSGSTFTVEDTALTNITPGTGCTTVAANKVSCTGVTAVTVDAGDLGDFIDARVAVPVTVNGGTGPADVKTGSGNDTITTDAALDVINAGSGNDTITTGDGADQIQPGPGDDNVTSGPGVDNINHLGPVSGVYDGDDGNDTINAGDGNDVVYDYDGNNTIYMGTGDDYLVSSIGTNQIYGEDGNDSLDVSGSGTVNAGNGDDWVWVSPGGTGTTFTGGAGTDMISYAEYDDDVQVAIGFSTNGADGENHTINSDIENIMGGRGNDYLYGNAGNNVIIPGIGNDVVTANSGNDTIDMWLDTWGPAGNELGDDDISGGDGIDTVDYQSLQADPYAGRPSDYPVTVTLDGVANDGTPGLETDNIRTNVENVTGTNGDDVITGSSVANTLVGGGGDDVLQGLGGTDVFVGDRTDASCTDNCVPGTKDTVSYASSASAVTASLDGAANDGASGENENIPSSIEKLIGSPQADTLTAGTYSATLVGGLGADTLRGGSANDVLIANDGVVDAVLECKGGSADYVLRDSNETAYADCETSVTSDTPNTIVSSAQVTGSTVNQYQTWTFTSDKPGGKFECASSSTSPATNYYPCTSPWLTGVQSNGATQYYSIRAVSSTGVVDATPANYALTYDTAAPTPTISTGPQNGDVVTTSTVQFAFSATGEPVTYECRLDEGTWAACTSPYTSPSLANGEHDFQVRSKDAVGNRSAALWRQFTKGSQILTVPAGVTPASTVNLTTDGTLGASLDWIHLKSNGTSTIDRKNVSTQRILGLTGAGTSGNWSTVSSGTTTWNWTDAAGGTASGSSDIGTSRYLLDGRGFKFSVPAVATETRKLRIWVGVRGATTVGTLKVNFGSQTPTTQTVAGTSTTTIVNKEFTIDYRPLKGSDLLNVEFSQTAGGNATGSAVVLYGAALY